MKHAKKTPAGQPMTTHMVPTCPEVVMTRGEVRYVLDKRRVALAAAALLLSCAGIAKVATVTLAGAGTTGEAARQPVPAVASRGTIIAMDEVSATVMPFDWEPSADAGPKRVAHQKNSQDRMDAAGDFYGIEVDLRGAVGEDDYKLCHDDYHGYTLRKFLSDCKNRGQMAILDLKYDADPEGASDVVADMGMLADTIFQTGAGDIAKSICQRHPKARCWLLNGAGKESGLRVDDLEAYAPYLEGVNICGSVVGTDGAKAMVDAVHAIEGHGDEPLAMCIFAYGTRTDVYGNDDLYESLGVEYLMTDVCPEPEPEPLD